jgi:sulfur carrier protein ThiS adenylyltransferase
MIDTTRQSGIIPDDKVKNISVAIVGAGSIGSHTAEALCKMGVRKLRIFDFDDVEAHNVANQGYFIPEIGYKKCEALQRRLSEGTGAEIVVEARKYEDGDLFQEDYVISAVDNMSSRSDIWSGFLMSPNSKYFLDGRMGARAGSVFFVDKTKAETVARYDKSLFPDEEAVQLPCTEKSTIFCAYGLSGIIGALIARSLIGDEINYSVDVDFAEFHLFRNI